VTIFSDSGQVFASTSNHGSSIEAVKQTIGPSRSAFCGNMADVYVCKNTPIYKIKFNFVSLLLQNVLINDFISKIIYISYK